MSSGDSDERLVFLLN